MERKSFHEHRIVSLAPMQMSFKDRQIAFAHLLSNLALYPSYEWGRARSIESQREVEPLPNVGLALLYQANRSCGLLSIEGAACERNERKIAPYDRSGGKAACCTFEIDEDELSLGRRLVD
jgi:hypothetical protein